MKRYILALAIILGIGSFGLADAQPVDAGPVLVEPFIGAGPAPAPAAPKPSDSLDNPATDPVAAWDDAKAAKKIGWVALVFALGVMLAKLAGTLGKSIRQLAWLDKGKTAVVVGGVLAVGAAGYDTLASGGSLLAVALGAWTAFWAYWNAQKAA